jgi:hypothetical protein
MLSRPEGPEKMKEESDFSHTCRMKDSISYYKNIGLKLIIKIKSSIFRRWI